jgi:Peptidase C13 family
MNHALSALGRNLVAGLRLAFFMPVTRLAFRIDLGQLLVLFVASAAIDIATDWIRFGLDARFSWLGAGGELYTISVLLLSAAAQALLFRQRALALAIPVLALAAYPAIQLIHIVPYAFSALDTDAASMITDPFEIAMAGWSILVLVRSVAVALVPSRPYRLIRALVGGLMLAVPIAFAPAVTSTGSWWQSRSAPADGRYPNPASEPVLTAQQTLLDDALSNLEDETPGATDLYFVAFAGDARDDAYRQDVLAAQSAMDERWDTQGRSVALINSPSTLLDTPMATVTHLRETLNEIAAAINPDEDVVMLYLAGPSDGEGVLEVALPPLELVPLTPAVLRSLLDEAGIVWRIVVVSSCRAQAFAEALQGETTLVLAAAGEGTTGDCARAGATGNLGTALFRDALSHADSLQQAFEAAQANIATGETGGEPAAQLFIGEQIAQKLQELDQRRATRGAGRTI